MKERYELAKKQGLNWQALIIEDLETTVPLFVKRKMIEAVPFGKIWRELEKQVDKEVEEFTTEELKAKTKNAMFLLAKRTFYFLYRTFFGIGVATFLALNRVANKTGDSRDYELVSKQMELKGVYKHAVPLDTYANDYMKLVDYQMDYLAKIDAKERYDERVSMRNIAEMTVRHEKQEHDLQKLKDAGVRLVWIEPHANCSERCEPWQGRLYSLDGTTGKTDDGVNYIPLEVAMNVYYTTKAGNVYKNGCISGYNCRHKLIPYKQGVRPIEIPAKVVAHARAVNDKQRNFERKVRYFRKLALLYKGNNGIMYMKAREKAIAWNKAYIEFSQKNGVPYYPSRTQILD